MPEKTTQAPEAVEKSHRVGDPPKVDLDLAVRAIGCLVRLDEAVRAKRQAEGKAVEESGSGT